MSSPKRRVDLAIVYVCDQSRLHQLALSIFSWKRFCSCNLFVVDIGLSKDARAWLVDVCGVKFLAPLSAGTKPNYFGSHTQRINAYREKSRVGLHDYSKQFDCKKIIYLDSDIVVTDASFLACTDRIREDVVVASPSAWDRDFTWSYHQSALSILIELSGLRELSLSEQIPNSGVVAADAASWRRLSADWSMLYESFLAADPSFKLVRRGRLPGDQEFIALACKRLGIRWDQLSGSYNMQISPKRMRWIVSGENTAVGGHYDEPPQTIRAVHFGCSADGGLDLPHNALGHARLRRWFSSEVAVLWESLLGEGFDAVRRASKCESWTDLTV